MSNDPIQAAIEAAKANASAISQDANANMNGALSTQNQSTAVSAAPARGAPLKADDMLAGGALDVKAWLKVNEFGLFIGNDKTPLDKIEAVIDLGQVAYCYSVRFGNPAQYEKTYDRVVSAKGQSWLQVLAMAQKITATASEFRSADVPFIVQAPLKNKAGEVLADVGDRLGHSLSVTGWKALGGLLREAQALGIDINTGLVKVTVECSVQSAKGNTWGILKFSNVENAAEPE